LLIGLVFQALPQSFELFAPLALSSRTAFTFVVAPFPTGRLPPLQLPCHCSKPLSKVMLQVK
jgi:hypothetical protein